MAPEQLEDHQVGPSADLWSLGIIVLECLTGRRPYAGTPSEVFARRLAGPVRLPIDLPVPRNVATPGAAAPRRTAPTAPTTSTSATTSTTSIFAGTSGTPATAAGIPAGSAALATLVSDVADGVTAGTVGADVGPTVTLEGSSS
jgi:eukaryotic-like serine/threonine-protein kinase